MYIVKINAGDLSDASQVLDHALFLASALGGVTDSNYGICETYRHPDGKHPSS